MAEIKFSQLTTAAQLTNDDIFALAQMQGGSLSSVKTSMIAVANFLNTQVQYTTAYNTQAKTTSGAINELKQLISLIPQFSIEVVQTLPTEDISDTTIYLVPAEDPEVGNYYEEYIHVNDSWELVGTTAVDLSAYYTKLEVDGLLADKLEADDFEANQTASANPITLETKQAGLAKSCVVEMNPIQDLHGYEYPWVGGAGKNKFQTTATSSGNFTVNSDGTVTVNGSFSGTSQFTVGTFDFKANTQYKLVGCPSGGGGSSYALYARGTEDFNQQVDQGNGVTFTPATDVTTEIRIIIYSGYTASNVLFKPMISTDTSVTYATFAPYSNICPISGRTEVSVTRTGKNLFDNTATESGYINSTGNVVSPAAPWLHEFIKIIGGLTYTVSGCNENNSVYHVWYDENMNFISNFSRHANGTFTAPNNAGYMGICAIEMANASHDLDTIQVEIGNQATAYEPYTAETHTKEFGQTVYGGTLDMTSGKLLDEWATIIFDGSNDENWGVQGVAGFYIDIPTKKVGMGNYISDKYKATNSSGWDITTPTGNFSGHPTLARLYFRYPYEGFSADLTVWRTWLSNNNVTVAYELATPTTIQLPPEALTLLKGLNVISTDGDKVQVEFSDIPVGDYSALLDYIKSLEARIEALEG